jgi:hypothetical protein
MFSEPTVFVIGAGASNEFQMPLGSGLKASIAESLGDEHLLAILAEANYLEAATKLRSLIKSFSLDSIDEILPWFSDHVDIIALGKMMIVREIVKAERNSRLFNERSPDILPS